MAFASSQLWIFVIGATLVGMFYWFSKEEKRYRERINLSEYTSQTPWGNKNPQPNSQNQQQNVSSGNKEIQSNQPRELIRNQGYNGSNESNNFGSVSRRSTLQNGNDGGYLFQRQDGNNHPKNDYRMSQSQYLSKKDPRNSFYSETSNKEYYSPAPESNFNTFSQNQTHHQSQNTIQFNKSSVPIRSKNPYLDPNDDDIIMHKNTNFSNEKMTPETEKIISKSSEKFSSNMNIESSPNYQDHNPNLLKSSSQNNVKKPTKKEDDLPVKSPIKKGLGNEDAKDKKKSGHLKTIPIMDDYEDEDEPESITFLNKEESKKALRNDKLKELTDKKRARTEIQIPLYEDTMHEFKANNSLKKFLNNMEIKEYQLAELYKPKDWNNAFKKKHVEPPKQPTNSLANLSSNTQNQPSQDKPAQSGENKPTTGLFGNKPDSGASGGLFGNKAPENKSAENKPAENKPTENKPVQNTTTNPPLFAQKPVLTDASKAAQQNTENKTVLTSNPTNPSSAGGLFNKPAEQAQPNTNTNSKPGLFSQGSTNTTTQTSSNPVGGLFGNNTKPTEQNQTNNANSQNNPPSNANTQPNQVLQSNPTAENKNPTTENKAPMTGLFTNLGQATKPEGQSTVPKLDLGSKSSGGGLFGNLTNNSNNNNQNNPNPSLTNPNAITNPNNQQPANDGKPKPFGNISQASLGTTVSTLESDNKNENPNPNPNPTTNTNTNTTTITNTSIIANSNNNANNTANKPSDNSLAIPSLGRKDAMDSTTKPGLFGSTGSSTGIFGNQNSSNANKPLSSIFGGGSNSQSNGLFGASNSGNSTGNTGLFGNNKK